VKTIRLSRPPGVTTEIWSFLFNIKTGGAHTGLYISAVQNRWCTHRPIYTGCPKNPSSEIVKYLTTAFISSSSLFAIVSHAGSERYFEQYLLLLVALYWLVGCKRSIAALEREYNLRKETSEVSVCIHKNQCSLTSLNPVFSGSRENRE
jgi:hypothetical protein